MILSHMSNERNGHVSKSLHDFLSSLASVKANNTNAKELELARLKNKLRTKKATFRKQKQRMREMAANLKATEEEVNNLELEVLRVSTELNTISDDDLFMDDEMY